MHGETSRAAVSKEVDGEAVMEGVEHLGKYVFDMQNAKFEAMKANGGQLPTREVKMVDGGDDGGDDDEDDGEDGEENVLVPDEAEDDDDGEEEMEVKSSGRHLEVEATSSVQIG
jgi:intron-binding protein aquarius